MPMGISYNAGIALEIIISGRLHFPLRIAVYENRHHEPDGKRCCVFSRETKLRVRVKLCQSDFGCGNTWSPSEFHEADSS